MRSILCASSLYPNILRSTCKLRPISDSSQLAVLGLSLRERFLRTSRNRINVGYPRKFHTRSLVMTAKPAQSADQLVQHDSGQYKAVKEGLASILTPPTQSKTQTKDARPDRPDHEVQSVFYNPIQQFNRDLSVLAIRAFGEHVLASKKKKRRSESRE